MCMGLLPVSLGTHQLTGKTCSTAVECCIKLGIKAIDTAVCYRNIDDIADGLVGAERANIHLTDKIPPDFMRPGQTEKLVERIRRRVERFFTKEEDRYIDLLLIHWPSCSKTSDPDIILKQRRECWKKMEEMVEVGLVKNIGVSNFQIRHLEDLLSYAKVPIACNQIEFHIACRSEELRSFMKLQNIPLVAYSPLGTGRLLKALSSDEDIIEIAKTEAQKLSSSALTAQTSLVWLLLKWCLQNAESVLPKSSRTSHIEELAAFNDAWMVATDECKSISAGFMSKIDYLVSKYYPQDEHFCWHSNHIP